MFTSIGYDLDNSNFPFMLKWHFLSINQINVILLSQLDEPPHNDASYVIMLHLILIALGLT